jgi:hypothetical protein
VKVDRLLPWPAVASAKAAEDDDFPANAVRPACIATCPKLLHSLQAGAKHCGQDFIVCGFMIPLHPLIL